MTSEGPLSGAANAELSIRLVYPQSDLACILFHFIKTSSRNYSVVIIV